MVFSHSRVELYERCPRRYKYRYIDGIKTIPTDDPADPLRLGTALHRGIETDAETAIHEYLMSYPVISDAHINETIKLEAMIEKCKAVLPNGFHEVPIHDKNFTGFIDLLAPVTLTLEDRDEICFNCNGYDKCRSCQSGRCPYGKFNKKTYDLYDFKYSNNVETYMNGRQLHEYKYFFERTHPRTMIRNLYFVFVPKISMKQKSTEDIYTFRKRLREALKIPKIEIKRVEYKPQKVIDFYALTQDILTETEFDKNETSLCRFCEYEIYCKKGLDYMNLPTTERRKAGGEKKRKIWIYGAPFSGKTTMLDAAPNPLNVNTDGNIKFVTMPFVAIKDIVTVDGRQTKRKFAWEVFKETIDELEKKQNDFETIIVDLVEDTREMCRLFKYDELGIQHESDSGYGKGWDIIKTEYLSTLRRLFNLNYENIVIVSHEVSSEVKKKNGLTITKIAPNLSENISSKIAGMVDIVARVVVEDDDTRTLNFKSNEYIFGGGRLSNMRETTIPLEWSSLMRVFDDAESAQDVKEHEPVKVADEVQTPVQTATEAPTEQAPRRGRRVDATEAAEEATAEATAEPKQAEATEQPAAEEKPVRRTRKVRPE